MTIFDTERITSGGIQREILLPLDEKIIGGIVIANTVDQNDLTLVSDRLQYLFDMQVVDKSREAGDCIAYGIQLDDELCGLVENELLAVGAKQGSSNVPTGADRDNSGLMLLWQAKTTDRLFQIRRNNVPVALSDGTTPNGNIYSLHSWFIPSAK